MIRQEDEMLVMLPLNMLSKKYLYLYIWPPNALAFFATIGFYQSRVDSFGVGVSEEWKTQNVRDAIELDSLFGAPQNLQRVRSLRLWQPAKHETKSGSVLPIPPHQIEGSHALADNRTANPPDVAGAVRPDHMLTAMNTEFAPRQ